MKTTLTRVLVLTFVLAAASPLQTTANSTNPATVEARVVELEKRLEEIKSIDRKSLSREERKALRHEVKEIKKELQGISGGVYLSIGAIILVALLLILLL